MLTRNQTIERLMESFQAIKRKLAPKNTGLRSITPSQWCVLRIVSMKDHASIKDIASQMNVSSSAATQLVDCLVEHGHLTRSNNPDDRRSQHIGLSASARKEMHQLRKAQSKRLAQLFSVLDDRELAQYLRLSTKIAGHVSPSA